MRGGCPAVLQITFLHLESFTSTQHWDILRSALPLRSSLQSPLALPLCCTHLAFASGILHITCSGRMTQRQNHLEGWRPNCAYLMFPPSTLQAFLRQHVRNPGVQFCSVGCKQVFGGALTLEDKKNVWGRKEEAVKGTQALTTALCWDLFNFCEIKEGSVQMAGLVTQLKCYSEMLYLMVGIKWGMYSTPLLKFKGHLWTMCTTFHVRFNCD